MPERARLPNRRHCESFTMNWWNQDWNVTVGYYDHREIGEIFINSVKRAGSNLDASIRDEAVLFSFARQYGAPIEAIRKSLTRDAQGRPETIIGAILDLLIGEV